MERRDFVTGLLLAVAAGPALAQAPAKQHRIALVHAEIPANRLTETAGGPGLRAFFEELRRLGHAEGSNLIVERYSAEGKPERFTEIARQVVGHNPDLVVVQTTRFAREIKAASATIPIVAVMGDPIRTGFVTDLAHPGENVTGISVDAGYEVYGKRLQILKEFLRSASIVAFLAMPWEWEGPPGEAVREAGRRLAVTVTGASPQETTASAFERLFDELAQRPPDAIMVSQVIGGASLIPRLAEKYRLPAMYSFRRAVELGGLMSYGSDLKESWRHIAYDLDQILAGAKPGDIPIYQATKFELVLNLKTAKALDLTFPPSLLAAADEVIE